MRLLCGAEKEVEIYFCRYIRRLLIFQGTIMEFVLAETRERNTSEQERAATLTLGMRRNCHNGQSREQRNEFKAMVEFFYNMYFDYKRRNTIQYNFV